MEAGDDSDAAEGEEKVANQLQTEGCTVPPRWQQHK